MEMIIIPGIHHQEYAEGCDMIFALSDFVNEDEEYAKYFKNRPEDKHCIMDNMAAENGQSSSLESVFKAALKIIPDEMWASDKLYDKDETLKLTKTFIEEIKKHPELDRTNIVGVPQGKDHWEWMECYVEMMNNPDIDVIALSKYSCPNAFKEMAGTNAIGVARPYAVNYLHDMGLIRKPLHLAGADHLIINEINAVKDIPSVRSIDSNILFKLGLHCIKVVDCLNEPDERMDHHLKELTEGQEKTIKANIRRARLLTNGL